MQNTNLTPDEDGYYTVVLGRLGRPDINGLIKHPIDDAMVIKLNKRGHLGVFRGEVTHPRRAEHLDDNDYRIRVNEILESRVSHVIKDIVVTMEDDPDGYQGKSQRITARVKPIGPMAFVLEELIARNEPVYMGLRAFTTPPCNDPSHPVTITHIVAWDMVGENPYPEIKKVDHDHQR